MRTSLMIFGIAGPLMAFGLATSSAGAFPGAHRAIQIETDVTPIAMCGWSCRGGGRYIPGPPSVCAEEGLQYCGRSRRDYGPPERVIVPVPGFGDRGRRDGSDERRDPRTGQRDGIDGRQRDGRAGDGRSAPSRDNTPCRQRLTNNKGEGYWGPGRNCDQGR